MRLFVFLFNLCFRATLIGIFFFLLNNKLLGGIHPRRNQMDGNRLFQQPNRLRANWRPSTSRLSRHPRRRLCYTSRRQRRSRQRPQAGECVLLLPGMIHNMRTRICCLILLLLLLHLKKMWVTPLSTFDVHRFVNGVLQLLWNVC